MLGPAGSGKSGERSPFLERACAMRLAAVRSASGSESKSGTRAPLLERARAMRLRASGSGKRAHVGAFGHGFARAGILFFRF